MCRIIPSFSKFRDKQNIIVKIKKKEKKSLWVIIQGESCTEEQ